MKCIQFRDVPTGEAPWKVRNAWTDLVLPLHSPNPVQGRGVQGVLTGQQVLDSGYRVRALEAFDILGLHHPEAENWWRTNLPHFFHPKADLIFSVGVCEVVDALPSITFPREDGDETIGIEEFLQQLEELREENDSNRRLADGIFVSCIKDALSPKEWEELKYSRLTRPIIFLFSSMVTEWATHKWYDSSISKESRNAIHDGGHAFLRAIHRIAAEQGVPVELQEVDKPISLTDLVDMAIQVGIFEELEDGTIRPTSLAEELAQRHHLDEGETDLSFYRGDLDDEDEGDEECDVPF